MSKKIKALFIFLGILLVILLWDLIHFCFPGAFFTEFFQTLYKSLLLLGRGSTYFDMISTLLRLFLSFAFSAILGCSLGLLASYYPWFESLLAPLITILKSFPTIALGLLLVVYVKNFYLYVTGIALFPMIYQASLEGGKKVYKKYEYLFRLKGRKHFSNLTSVILPLSSDHIFLGLIQALPFGLKVEVMAETLSYRSDSYGMGKALLKAYNSADYSSLLEHVLLLLIFALVFEGVLWLLKSSVQKRLKADGPIGG